MKRLLIVGAAVLFAGIAATGAAAAEHRSTKHVAPAGASVMMSAPAAHKDAAPKKHGARKKHHGRRHHKRHAK